MYYRGIASRSGFLQSLWPQQVKKAAEKYAKPASSAPAVPSAGQDPEARAVEALRAKLKAGKKLSPAELDFLREHAPELYAKAVKVAMERDEYERSLRRCETGEAVQRAQNLKMAQMAERFKHMDPEEAEMTANAIADVNREYRKSDEYRKIKAEERTGDAPGA